MANGNSDLPSWDEAMARAAERLRMVEAEYGVRKGMHSVHASAHMDIVRAWIAYAQEVGSHRRAERGEAAGREAE